MQITESQILKLHMNKLEALDPINVMLEDFGPGRGRITIECFGSAWSNAWGAMGEQYDMVKFFLSCDVHYLANKLRDGQPDREYDYDALQVKLLKAICGKRRLLDFGKQFSRECYDTIQGHTFEEYNLFDSNTVQKITADFLGDDWYMEIPTKYTSGYTYLCRIIETVKAGLLQWQQEKPT